MMTPRSWVGVVLGLAACGKDAPPAPAPLDVFPSTITPPAPFDKLRLGMTTAEAKGVLPTVEDDLPLAPGIQGRAWFDRGKLASIVVFYDHPLTPGELSAKWGKAVSDREGKPSWLGPAWKATFACKKPAECIVDYTRLPRPLTAAFFGKVVAPPGALAPLRPHMDYATAKRLAPGLIGEYEELDPDLGVDDVRADVIASRDQGVLKIGLQLDPSRRSLLEEAWGQPVPALVRHAGPKPRPCWAGPTWRACVIHEHEASHSIELQYLQPLATLLGKDALLGPPLEPLLGATADDLAARGLDLGERRIWTEVRLPDTEYGDAKLRVMFGASKTVERATLDVYYDDAQRDEVYGALAARWGAPTKAPTVQEAERDGFQRVLRKRAPKVVLGARSFAWRLTFER